ncbi:PocR ligand-binding domain-containing protein [Bianquea renquensis]|jgi:transcriptional regulator, araC family|uniref:PocR ligand-binding domain-containing protein n=1 Tax=Bianquea renquensis TaxID=2763661 RepID=A0A926HZC3_9FIRM|nr:AraC family transcriptional regulator [Bianquea renquensis]MBC8541999.1 PocR ligand-binding domain-containing protein [Bianquea renquensis]
MKNSEDRIQRDKEIEAIESYALSTGIYTKLVDSNGEVIASAGRPCEYCRFCAEHQPDKDFRSKTYRYGSMQAQRFGGKYIYFCPMGLTNWASPIMKDGILVGALTAGPVMMFDMEEYIEFDLALRLKLEKQTKEQVRTLLQQLPFMEPKRVTGLAEQLFYTAAYLCEGDNDDYWMRRDNQQNQSDISEYIQCIKNITEGLGQEVYPIEKEKELLAYITDGNNEDAQRVLNEILGHILFHSGGNLDVIKVRVLELVIVLSRAVMESGGDVEMIFGWNLRYVNDINQITNFEDLTVWLSSIIRRFGDMVFGFSDVKHVDIMYKADKYIKQHYMEKLTLEDVASQVYLSPSYFSKIFKEEMGASFNNYLNKVRVDNAKRLLLKDGVNLVDISNMVGYEDQSYFSKVFKKLSGVTPGKFRETRGKNAKG